MKDAQPYKFVINNPDGTQTTGGAESKELAIDHLRHCLLCEPRLVCWYTGKGGRAARPQRIRRLR